MIDNNYVSWFKELSKTDIPLVGGKGANLGEMYNANIPIPPGFCVTTKAYKLFLEHNKLSDEIYDVLHELDVENNEKLQEASKKVQEIIMEGVIPDGIREEVREAYDNLNVNQEIFKNAGKALDIIKAGRDVPFVAVRSSATAEDLKNASFAGQQATFLNVKGFSNLIRNVQRCWASLFTARAIYYRVKNNFPHEKVLIAVIVQKMVNSEKSGVIFSANPMNNNKEEIVIEGGWGLGEAVVSGAINPDNYILNKKDLKIKKKDINEQDWMYTLDVSLNKTVRRNIPDKKKKEQVLSDFEIKKLGELTVLIENHYQKPQDIEFAIEGSKIYIVQSRPITTLKKKPHMAGKEKGEESAKEEIKGEVILEGLGASPGVGSGVVKILKSVEELGKIEKGDVLVTEMTNPDMVPAMERASAIVTNEGGTTCHAAIVSRELGIPAIVGTEKATEVLKEGEKITVDGSEGKVYKGEVEIKQEKEEYEIHNEDIETVTGIKVLIDMPKLAEKAAATGADGVGLLRAEFMILNKKEHPWHMIKKGRKDEFVEGLKEDMIEIASHFKGKPMWYRTLDAPTDEFRHMEGGEDEPEEDNPMMGWRSIRRDLDQPELLKAQFEAIKKVHDAGYTNIGVMLPLVTDVEQIQKAKEYLREFDMEPMENIEFGVMIETPASVQIIEEICKEGVDFVSFGTNDLTQFTLAVDRNNAKVQGLYNEKHPAVIRQIEKVINICKEYNVETSICGQAGSDEEMAEILVKLGIDSISANIDAVRKIRYIVHKIEKKLLLDVARDKIKNN